MADAELKDDLKGLLELVDKTFGIDRVLADKGRDLIKEYYAQSGPAYEAAHSKAGCMHLALNPDGEFSFDGYRRQPRSIVKEMTEIGGSRVLELGCGKGFNSLIVAQRLPEATCIGTDLLEDHLVKARELAREAGASNLSYDQASYEPLPDRFRDMDVIFAVETLCYAKDIDAVARAIAAALRPGGRFVMFDVHSWQDADSLPPDLSMATRLYETSMVVTRGFIRAGAWEAALQRAGLAVDETRDLSRAVQPGLRRLQGMGLGALGDWKKRLALKAMPQYMARNGISALLGPLVYRLPKRNREAALCYQRISATKPAA
ncbi:methyltransferase domain-containing protein [Tabrizicola oligotrophica]|uniref:Class I SAM-dependent methyltransferase n=1 Tax=Tabrizicola oligotrophica TaxID=2710650 RepID=A0A6M0QV24_9RHOB|nr:methyltransferase domain-containing protein [Tabrizicola oligotrophica]NEY91336.1 class I SAM-dependent methyltransferase [Tabrizicola oligotrophica]